MRFLTAATLKNFRCYESTEKLELDHVNIFAGPNNAGKSALLNALRRLVSINLNRHPVVGTPGGASFWTSATQLNLSPGDWRDDTDSSEFSLHIGEDLPLQGERPRIIHARFQQSQATSLWRDEQSIPAPDSIDSRSESAVRAIDQLPLVVIPEHRTLSPGFGVDAGDPLGAIREETVTPDKLFRQLVEWACEAPERIHDVEAKASGLLGVAVRLKIRPSTKTLDVSLGPEPTRSLHHLGTGIVEVLTLSVASVRYPRALLLYEEPENHLHPWLQRRVIAHLIRLAASAWQVLLTTHSNHVLDHGIQEGVSTFSVRRSAGRSRLSPVVRSHERARLNALLDDLGVRPSSGLQSQVLIWVEGPSDAIYMRFFLQLAARQADAKIEEYIDFAFAFFGGALLAHQSALLAPIPSLVDLVGIHRNSFVILDSDRVEAGGPLGKDYAARFTGDRCLPERFWVTSGREMENYLADEVLLWAATDRIDVEALIREHALRNIDRLHHIFAEQVREVANRSGRIRAAHDASDPAKTRFATAATEMMASASHIDWLATADLRDQLDSLLALIRRVRGDFTESAVSSDLERGDDHGRAS